MLPGSLRSAWLIGRACRRAGIAQSHSSSALGVKRSHRVDLHNAHAAGSTRVSVIATPVSTVSGRGDQQFGACPRPAFRHDAVQGCSAATKAAPAALFGFGDDMPRRVVFQKIPE